MNASYQLSTGEVGVLISMPHNGQCIPQYIAQTMTDCAKEVADTDWYLDSLYDFAQSLKVYTLVPKYSRYVIDLNRNPNGESLYIGENNTELCPTSSFNLDDIYLKNQKPSSQEVQKRVHEYWRPYHQVLANTLGQLKQQYGKVVLLDAHSILSQVPRFFSGTLTDFNFGSADGISCDENLLEAIKQINLAPYSCIFDGRFKGGYITRAYGKPSENIHAIQLELSQRTYMDEANRHYNEQKATQVKSQLKKIVQTLIDFSHKI